MLVQAETAFPNVPPILDHLHGRERGSLLSASLARSPSRSFPSSFHATALVRGRDV